MGAERPWGRAGPPGPWACPWRAWARSAHAVPWAAQAASGCQAHGRLPRLARSAHGGPRHAPGAAWGPPGPARGPARPLCGARRALVVVVVVALQRRCPLTGWGDMRHEARRGLCGPLGRPRSGRRRGCRVPPGRPRRPRACRGPGAAKPKRNGLFGAALGLPLIALYVPCIAQVNQARHLPHQVTAPARQGFHG